MATRTTSQNGDWSLSSTWGGLTPPGVGDYAVVNHNVTVTGNTTIGDGTAVTVLDSTNGTVTITGAVLTINGNSLFGKTHSGTTTTVLTVQNSGATQGGLQFKANSSVRPTMTLASDSLLVFTGTSTARAFVKADSGNLGLAPTIASTSTRSFFMQASFCDFSGLGDSSTDGMTVSQCSTSTSLANPPFTMDHCTVDSCGILPRLVLQSGTVNFQITSSQWTNSLNATFGLIISGISISGGGTRLVNNCTFIASPEFSPSNDFSITNCWIEPSMQGSKSSSPWAQFDGNFFRHTIIEEVQIGGHITNCFLYSDITPSTSHTSGFVSNCNGDQNYTGNVMQSSCTVAEANWQFAGGESQPFNRNLNATYNIVLPNAGGFASRILISLVNNPSDPGNGNPWPTMSVDHNTVHCNSNQAIQIGSGSFPLEPGNFHSCKSNIFWAGSLVASQFAVTDGTTLAENYPDPITGANCDYNAWRNLSLATRWVTSTAANGTPYDMPLTTTPGVHDQTSTNPQFVDSTRNLQTWDAALGGAGTAASAMTRIKANLTLTKSSLIPWIRSGYWPTNAALKGTAHDGTTIGAVQAPGGNPNFGIESGGQFATIGLKVGGRM